MTYAEALEQLVRKGTVRRVDWPAGWELMLGRLAYPTQPTEARVALFDGKGFSNWDPTDEDRAAEWARV